MRLAAAGHVQVGVHGRPVPGLKAAQPRTERRLMVRVLLPHVALGRPDAPQILLAVLADRGHGGRTLVVGGLHMFHEGGLRDAAVETEVAPERVGGAVGPLGVLVNAVLLCRGERAGGALEGEDFSVGVSSAIEFGN